MGFTYSIVMFPFVAPFLLSYIIAVRPLLLLAFLGIKLCGGFSKISLGKWRLITWRYLFVGPWGPVMDALWLPWYRLCYSQRVLYVSYARRAMVECSLEELDEQMRRIEEESKEEVEEGRTVRIVALSDTHGKHASLQIPPCDLLVHTGDVLLRNSRQRIVSSRSDMLSFNRWLGELKKEGVLKGEAVVIAGNHDQILEDEGGVEEVEKNLLSNACYLEHSVGRIPVPSEGEEKGEDELIVFGSPFSYLSSSQNSAFQLKRNGEMYPDDESELVQKELFQALQDDPDAAASLDILLMHSTLSKRALFSSRSPVKQAKVVIGGHFHSGHGASFHLRDGREPILEVNASSCDDLYHPLNPVIVIDYPV